MIQIRPAISDDAPRLVELIREFATHMGALDAVLITDSELATAINSARECFICYVAENEGDPSLCGYAAASKVFSTWLGVSTAHLDDLYVRTELRGRGIGRMLVRAVSKHARTNGRGRLGLEVREWNPAKSFYEAMGFLVKDDMRNYRMEGDQLSELEFSPLLPNFIERNN